ncbi:putative ribonuclease H-like domain-containing protein, partial [Tanacetum coccineum]
SAFFYGQIEEEVYVCQPPGFEDPDYPDKVYKVVKALYGLHQAPRAWYETLANYLLGNGFQRGKIDQTLFIKKQKGDILVVQIYVDDIIFGFTKKEWCTEFEKLMKDKFQMSSMGELTFFFGLQVKQKEDGIFISQDKYVAEILRKFNYTDVKIASTPVDLEKPLVKDRDANDVDVHLYRSMIGCLMYLIASIPDIMFAVCACARFQVTPKTSHLLAVKRIFRYLKGKLTFALWYSIDSPFELVAYTDSDYARATQDRKSTTEGCQFLGNRLISWQCKKQTMVATSTTEAKYVAAASCCGQVLWIQNQLLDYRYNFMNTVINIDNNSTICIIENPVQHSKTKHIEIRHHFIRDCNAKKLIQMVKIHTDHNVADLLTKGFDAGRLVMRLSIRSIVKNGLGLPLLLSSLEAEQEQWGNISLGPIHDAQTRFEAASKQSNDPPLSRVNTLGSGEDNRKLKVLITEASIRRHLKVEDSEGLSSLPTAEIFRQLALIGVITPLFNTMLIQHQGEEPSIQTTPESSPSRITSSPSLSPQTHLSTSQPQTILVAMEAASMPHESPLQSVHSLRRDEGSFSLHELMLIKRVKKLKHTIKTSQAKRRAKVVISDDEDAEEDPSKQGRKISKINKDPTISLVQDKGTSCV